VSICELNFGPDVPDATASAPFRLLRQNARDGDPSDFRPIDADRNFLPFLEIDAAIVRFSRWIGNFDLAIDEIDNPIDGNSAPSVRDEFLAPISFQAGIGNLNEQANV
jgi:hypothetical protein